MLKLAGEFEIGREKCERIIYAPGIKDSGDLEAGTKTITATAEASGVGNADYSSSLTLSAPGDSRLIIERIAARLNVTIDSMTAGHLYCRVYIDAQDADHRLFDKDWTTTGSKLEAVDKDSGTIFSLLKGGSAHTFYFFFWVDSGNAVLSVVELWEGVGTCAASEGSIVKCLSIDHKGFVSINYTQSRQGTGTPVTRVTPSTATSPWVLQTSGSWARAMLPSCLIYDAAIWVYGSVAAALNYISDMVVILRSEQ
jgi:hypothetical protein